MAVATHPKCCREQSFGGEGALAPANRWASVHTREPVAPGPVRGRCSLAPAKTEPHALTDCGTERVLLLTAASGWLVLRHTPHMTRARKCSASARKGVWGCGSSDP